MNQKEADCTKDHFVEGTHYYINDEGYIVLTRQYHLEKGFCCGMGCLHCPYNYENVPEARRNEITRTKIKEENQ
jgi:Family of unknown function (DUF5522)